MSHRLITLAVGVGLTLTAAGPGAAQAQTRRYAVPSLDSIGPGCCTIRVRQNGLEAKGTFEGMPEPERVLLGRCSGPLCGGVTDPSRGLRLLPDAIVEMRSGSHAGLGLAIGAASGAGLALGMFIIGGCDDCDTSAGDYALLGLVGAAGGGVIGALVGALIPNWIPIRH